MFRATDHHVVLELDRTRIHISCKHGRLGVEPPVECLLIAVARVMSLLRSASPALFCSCGRNTIQAVGGRQHDKSVCVCVCAMSDNGVQMRD